MGHRNRNLVFTNEDMMNIELVKPMTNLSITGLKRKHEIESEVPNKKQKLGITPIFAPRRSLRLANQNKNITSSNYTIKPTDPIDSTKSTDFNNPNNVPSDSESDGSDLSESDLSESDLSESDLSESDLSESDMSLSDDEIDFIEKEETESLTKKNFSVKAKKMLSSVLKETNESLMNAKKININNMNKKNWEDDDRFDDAIEELVDQPWFDKLSDDEKRYYVEKMHQLMVPLINIPSIKEIMDMKIDTNSIKTLILDRKDLDEYDKLSEDFNDACQKFIQKMTYFADKDYVQKQEQIKNLENNILQQHKFAIPMRDRILNNDHDDKIKSIIYDKYITMCGLDSEDSAKYQTWIETALSIPTKPKRILLNDSISQNVAISKLVVDMMNRLNNKIYGMTEAKEEFLCIVANMMANPKSKHKAIGLYGPPGIGKTMIAKVLAEVLELPMEQISLGGVTDSSFLEGHNFTYVSSEPGCIVKAVIKMKCTNGIIYLDELDKISKTDKGKEIEHALLHITDFTQNHDFRDKYMSEIPIDLSNYFFIYSMNTINELDSALASRIPVIKFDGYTAKEKNKIITEYVFPEILANYGMLPSDVILPESCIDNMIQIVREEDEVNGKSGVRGLKKALNRIINRINLYRLASVNGKIDVKLSFNIPNFKIPFTITNSLINTIIGNSDKSNCSISYLYT
jgi:ATP-dependent Lon protease